MPAIFDPQAIAKAGDNVVFMDPQTYLDLSPPLKANPIKDRKGKELRESVENQGDNINQVPSLAIAVDDQGVGRVMKQDGRHRAQLALEQGVRLIPVQIDKKGEKSIESVISMRGETMPWNVRKPKKWSSIGDTEEFRALPEDQKLALRQQYFDQVISPTLPTDVSRETLRARWAHGSRAAEAEPTPLPTEGMSTTEKVRAGAGKAFVDVARGVGLGDESNAQVRARDLPLMRDPAGFAGNVAGNLALAAPTAMLPGANTVLGASAYGAGFGALQPADTLSERFQAGLEGGALSGALTAAARALPTLKSIAIDPFTQAGRERIALSALDRFARDPASIRRAQGGEVVPGSRPTLAEATGDPGVAQLQRVVQTSPEGGSAFAERAVERNRARLDVLRDIAGDPAKLAAAEKARKTATAPLYQQVAESAAEGDPRRTVNLIDRIVAKNEKREAITGPMDKVRKSLFDAYPETQRGAEAWKELRDLTAKLPRMSAADGDALALARAVVGRVKDGKTTATEALDSLKMAETTSKTATDAINRAKAYLSAPDFVVTQDISKLQSASKNIGDLMSKKGPGGALENEAIVRELAVVKKSLDNAITRAEPAYGQAQKAFRDLSVPINRMQVGQTLLEKATSALEKSAGDPVLRAESFARLLRDSQGTVKAATGFKRNQGLESVLTKDQMRQVEAVSKDLARAAEAQEAGKVPGSPTAQYLLGQNIVRRLAGPLGLPESIAETVAADLLANRWISAAGKPAEAKIQARIAELLLNPTEARRAALALDAQRQSVGNITLRNLSRGVLPPVAIGLGPYVAQQ